MSLLALSWRNLLGRPVASLATVLVVATAIALAVLAIVLADGVRRGIDRAAEPYELLIGARGSAQQLVVNTVLLHGDPLGNVPFELYEALRRDPDLTSVVPLAYGDSYRGHKVVGTRAPFFELRNRPNDPPYFRLVSGRTFSAPFEAVLGSAAARQLALAPGATFRADHGELAPLPGEEEDDEHAANPYTVVGVLAPTRSPADRGIYVDLESYWRIHEHTGPADRAVTAIAVKGRRFPFDVYRVQQAINAGRLSRDAQAVVAYSELHELNGQIGQAGQALTAVAMVAIGLAGATVFLSLYGAIAERRRVLAVLRALGAGPRRVFALVLIESGLLCALGVVFGTTAGYLGAWLAGQVVYDARAIQVVVGFSPTVLGVVLVGLLLGPLAGLIPAAVAYRQPPDRHLAPT